MIENSGKQRKTSLKTERETRTRAGYPDNMPKLPDRSCEFGQMILLSNGSFACIEFRAIQGFRVFFG